LIIKGEHVRKRQKTERTILRAIRSLMKTESFITIKIIAEKAGMRSETLRGYYFEFIKDNCDILLIRGGDISDGGGGMTKAQQAKMESFMGIPDKACGIGLIDYNRHR